MIPFREVIANTQSLGSVDLFFFFFFFRNQLNSFVMNWWFVMTFVQGVGFVPFFFAAFMPSIVSAIVFIRFANIVCMKCAIARQHFTVYTWVRGNIWHKKKTGKKLLGINVMLWPMDEVWKTWKRIKKTICWQIFNRTLARVPSAQKNGLLRSFCFFFFFHFVFSFLRWHIRIKYVRAPRSRLHSTICFSRLRMCSCFVCSPIVKEAHHIGRLLPCASFRKKTLPFHSVLFFWKKKKEKNHISNVRFWLNRSIAYCYLKRIKSSVTSMKCARLHWWLMMWWFCKTVRPILQDFLI